MKSIIYLPVRERVIHFEQWPLDCLVRYLNGKQRLLLTNLAPKIITDIRSLNKNNSAGTVWICKLEDLFASSVNKLALQIARQDQQLMPLLNHLIVAAERKLPLHLRSFSVLMDCMDGIILDHAAQKILYGLMHSAMQDSRSEQPGCFYPQLFTAIGAFEKELFHILNLQQKILLPKITRFTSQF